MTKVIEKPRTVSQSKNRVLFSRFKKDSQGSVAIEFVLLAMPFCLLLFAIFEACIAFAAQQVMANAVDNVARDLRTNVFTQAAATPAAVRSKICTEMSLLVSSGCPGLVIDMKPYASFSDVPTSIPRTATGDVNEAGFVVTAGKDSDKMHLRIFYRWPYVTDFIGHKLAELPDNKTLLYASATWEIEPYLSLPAAPGGSPN
jgi:Flp pilus assembly protein TadG